MGTQIFSILEAEVNGEKMNLAPGSTFQPGGKDREAVEGDQSAGDYAEKLIPAVAELMVKITGSTSLEKLQSYTDAQVNLRLDTGQTYSMAGAWAKMIPAVSGNDGMARLTLTANKSDETVAGGSPVQRAFGG